MRLFHPVNSFIVSRNLCLVLLSKIWLFLNLVKCTEKELYNSVDSKSVLIFTPALVTVDFFFLLISWFFTKLKLQSISVNHAATWREKLAADFPSFKCCSIDKRLNSIIEKCIMVRDEGVFREFLLKGSDQYHWPPSTN